MMDWIFLLSQTNLIHKIRRVFFTIYTILFETIGPTSFIKPTVQSQ